MFNLHAVHTALMSILEVHKRKRSLQDSPVDLTLMKQARKCLVALQEELDGVVETSSEITAIMTQDPG